MKRLIPILMLIIAGITLIVMLDDSGQAKKFHRSVIEYINRDQKQDKSKEIIVYREPQEKKEYRKIQAEPRLSTTRRKSNISASKLLIAFRKFDFDSGRVNYIKNNASRISKKLTLPEVTKLLSLTDFDDDRIVILSLLRNKINLNYTDDELDRFLSVFDFDNAREKAESILHSE